MKCVTEEINSLLHRGFWKHDTYLVGKIHGSKLYFKRTYAGMSRNLIKNSDLVSD